MVAEAAATYPHLTFQIADIEDENAIKSLPGPFDVILLTDTLGALDDCQRLFDSLHHLCVRETRLVIGYFSHLWYPVLSLAEKLGMRMPQPPQNVLAPADIRGLAALADFELVKAETRMLTPVRMLGMGRLVNRFVAPFPVIRNLCLRHYSVFRSLRRANDGVRSASVIVPARNERGNIEAAVRRIPRFVEDLEIIFVEGHSKDGTWEEIERVAAAYPDHDIKTMRQSGHRKRKAMRYSRPWTGREATC